MKAAHWVATGRVVCEEAPVPSPAEGELLVRTAYASICGSDLHSVYGGPPPDPSPPGHPGHESVGEVVESRSQGFAPGDRVLTAPQAGPATGRTLAEYQAVSAGSCVKLPDGPPLSQLLMAPQ